VAYFNGLVDRLAEVPVVVGRDGQVGPGLGRVPRGDELPRGGRQPDLDGLRVLQEHRRPLAPGRPVALVDDDVREVAGRVVFGQERLVPAVVDAERLVGGDVDGRILGGVLARSVPFDDPGGVAEVVPQLAQGLRLQLEPVA